MSTMNYYQNNNYLSKEVPSEKFNVAYDYPKKSGSKIKPNFRLYSEN